MQTGTDSVTRTPKAKDATTKQIRGSGLLLVGRMASLGTNLLVQVLIVRYLTKGEYGAFAYALSIVTMAETVAILGLDRAVGRFLPMYDERKDYDRLFGAIALVLGTILTLGLAMIILFVGAQGLLTDTVITKGQAMSLLVIMIVLAPIQAMDNLLIGLFAIFSNAKAIFFRKHILGPLLKLAAVLILIGSQAGVSVLAIGYVVAGALGIAIYFPLLIRSLRTQGILQHFKLRNLTFPGREIFGFALPLLAVDLVFVLMNTSDVFLLGHFHDAEAVASLRAIRPAALLNAVVMASFTVLFTPLAARLFARKDKDGVKYLYWQTAIWIAILSFPVFALTFSVSKPVTVLLFGSRYEGSAIYLSLLAFGYYFNAALGFNGLTLRIFGRVRYVIVISLITAAFNIGINLLLIPSYGALGAAIGTCATLIVHNILKQTGLRLGTGISIFDWNYLSVYLIIAAGSLGLLGVQLIFDLSLIPSLITAGVVSFAVIGLTRRKLEVGETFPELLKFRFLRKIAGK